MHHCLVGKIIIKSRRDWWVVVLENTVLRCFWWVAEGQGDYKMIRKQRLLGYSAVLLVGCGDGGGLSVLTDGIWRNLEERCRWRWRGRDFIWEKFDNSNYSWYSRLHPAMILVSGSWGNVSANSYTPRRPTCFMSHGFRLYSDGAKKLPLCSYVPIAVIPVVAEWDI